MKLVVEITEGRDGVLAVSATAVAGQMTVKEVHFAHFMLQLMREAMALRGLQPSLPPGIAPAAKPENS